MNINDTIKRGGEELPKEKIQNKEGGELSLNKAREGLSRFGIKAFGRLDGKTEESFFLSFVRRLSIDRKFMRPLKYRIALAKDESLVFYILSYLGRLVLSLEIATYGTFLLLFSLTSVFTEVARTLIKTGDIYSIDYSVVLQSLILFILSFLLIFGGRTKNLSEGILGSSIMSFIFLDLFGVRRESLTVGERTVSGSYGAILLGVGFGIMTLSISPTEALINILVTVLAITVICVPESGVVMTILALPFLADHQLFMLIFFVWVCYIMKLLLGKRSFKATFTDGAVICFGLWVLLAGVVSLGGHENVKGIAGIWMIFSFVLVSTLIRGRQWIARCRSAVVLSAEIYGIIAVCGTAVKYISQRLSGDEIIFAYLPTDIPAVSKEDGIFLVLAIFFVLSSFKLNGEKKSGVGIFFMSAVLVAGIFLTFSWEIWLAFVAGFCFYSIYTRPKSAIAVIIIAVIIVALLIVIPDEARAEIMEFSNFSKEDIANRLENNKALFRSAVDNIFGGTGLSETALRGEMAKYTEEGYFVELGASNTLLLMVAQLGLFGACLFVFIFLLVGGAYTVWGRGSKTDRRLSSVGVSGLSSFFAFFVLGVVENVFAEAGITVLFWLLAGLVYSSCKVMKDEAHGFESNDEKVYYVERTKSEVKSDAR